MNTFFETRVGPGKRDLKAPDGYITADELTKGGLVAPVTDGGDNPLTGKLPHHSVRPASNPDPKVDLTPAELDELDKNLSSREHKTVKPIELHGQC